MKKILYILVSIFVASCSIDKSPFDSLTKEQIENLEGSTSSLTLGNYSLLKAWSENWHRLLEYPGDNVALSGTTTDNLFFIYNYQRIPNNSRANLFWSASFKVVVGANKVIETIGEPATDADKQLLAENYFLRAMVNFYMVNVFGRPYNQGRDNPGVPLKMDSDRSSQPVRSTVGQVYDQVEADLLKAVGLFVQTKTNIYATKEAAWALLARLYLYKEQNDKALEYANLVLGSTRLALWNAEAFLESPKLVPENSNNKETIFAIRFLKDVDNLAWSSVGSMYSTILGVGWGEMYASRPYLELVRKYPEDIRNRFIEPVVGNPGILWATYVDDLNAYKWKVVARSGNDYTYTENGTTTTLEKESNGAGGFLYYMNVDGKRRRALIDNQLTNRNGYLKYYILKCSNQEGQPQLWSPIVLRLAEMYLIRAEVYAKQGNIPLALNDVNTIRKRAGIPDGGLYTVSNLGGKTAMDIVMEERQLELAFEGHRKLDVFRNKLTMNRNYPGTHTTGTTPKLSIAFGANEVIEYIPEAQILIQKGLIQNP